MDSLEEWLERLKKADLPIIVEGKNDCAALEYFNISNVFVLSKTPLFDVVEKVAAASKKCVILTDLDAHGKELYGRLKRDLDRLGVKVDDSFRKFLFKNTKLRQIEGLISYYKNY